MPFYIYEHPETKQQIEVMQSMDDEHKFVDSEGVAWNRVFDVPSAKIDSISDINPFDRQEFVKRTAKKGMTLGDMWDESQRLSEKREASRGQDPVKEEAKKKYEKLTGKPHPHAPKSRKNKHVNIIH